MRFYSRLGQRLGLAFLIALLGACFGGQQQAENDLEVSEEQGETQQAAEGEEGKEGSADEYAEQGGDEYSSQGDEEALEEIMAESEAANSEGSVVDSAAGSEAMPSTPVGVGGNAPDPSRVVRYVARDGAEVYDSAGGSNVVATMRRGESLMVVEQEGYGRISDGMFMQAADLSREAVPRTFDARVWTTSGE